LLQVSLQNVDPHSPRRANRVDLVGCDERFWQVGAGRPNRLPGPHEIVLNRPAAERLGAKVGDAILLRLPSLDAIPAESALGKKRETVRTQRVTVSEIIPAEGLGTFSLRPTQRPPLNAYVSLDWLADRLDQPGRVNAILLAGEHRRPLTPDCADYGLHVERTPAGYWNITSDRLMLDPATEQAVLSAIREVHEPKLDVQPAMTYLANTLACNGREVPYSTITAIDFADRPPLGPFRSPDGKTLPPPAANEIVLNAWAADQLHARVGDTVQVSCFEPESLEGHVREKTVDLRLAGVVELAGAADDRALAPAVKGITDKLTMSNWDPPFPFDAKRIRPADEEYWNRRGATPKAFVSLATGRRLWGSRFGQTTSIRVAAPSSRFGAQLQKHLDPAAMGFVFQPIKRQQLAASEGATPFGVLFLCFSFFIITAAVMLVALLFRLGIDGRAKQIGTLSALGFSRRKLGRLLLGEGLVVAAAGSLLGVPVGIAYAALMLVGLQTWWLAAIVCPFLQLHITTASLAIGFASGLIAAMAAIWLSVRRIARVPPRQLLAGHGSRQATSCGRQTKSTRARWLQLLLLLLTFAPTAALLSLHVSEDLRAGMFFGAGATALAALLAMVWLRLRTGTTGPAVAAGSGNVARMALRNAARNPGRSTLTVALVASSAFVIVAMSAFRLDPTQQTPSLHSGNGGFALVAESDRPILQKPELPDARIVALRASEGDDASCLNLYRPRQPRVLGVPRQFVDRDGFAWADAPRDCENPWKLLDEPGDVVPVILDKNTANYSLQLWGGLGEIFEIDDARGKPMRLRVAALLADSIFQGDLIIGEPAFLRMFPDANGSRVFLVETAPQRTAAVRRTLEQDLGEYGFSAETTGRRLADLLAVQNTYLSTFQSLGGLGLLLGTLGLAVVELRNVIERRGELALLRATGFRRATLGWLVLLEHATLLAAGLGVGTLAASLAVLPHLLDRGASVPWASLAATLGAVLLVGLAAGALAVRAVVRAPLLSALREEQA
jgi:putative ABC transport system permease protein